MSFQKILLEKRNIFWFTGVEHFENELARCHVTDQRVFVQVSKIEVPYMYVCIKWHSIYLWFPIVVSKDICFDLWFLNEKSKYIYKLFYAYVLFCYKSKIKCLHFGTKPT